MDPRDTLRHLRDDGLRRAVKRVVRTYIFSRQRMYVTYVDLVEDMKKPLNLDGVEVRPARPDDAFGKAFPHVAAATITTWLRPDHIFYVLLHGGTLAGYRCVATTASPSLRPFFRLRPHQLYVIDHFVRPELRRLGLARIIKYGMARELVARGFTEAFGVESPTNHEVIVSNPRRGVMRIGTLIRTCRLGRIRFAMTPVAALTSELIQRQLAVLRQVAPRVSHAGVLFNPTAVTTANETDQATTVAFLPVPDAADQVAALEQVFATARNARIDGLIVVSDPMTKEYRRVIVRQVERLGIPAVYDAMEFVAAGGLMSYGAEPPRLHDLASVMAHLDRVQTAEHGANGRTPRLIINEKVASTLALDR